VPSSRPPLSPFPIDFSHFEPSQLPAFLFLFFEKGLTFRRTSTRTIIHPLHWRFTLKQLYICSPSFHMLAVQRDYSPAQSLFFSCVPPEASSLLPPPSKRQCGISPPPAFTVSLPSPYALSLVPTAPTFLRSQNDPLNACRLKCSRAAVAASFSLQRTAPDPSSVGFLALHTPPP